MKKIIIIITILLIISIGFNVYQYIEMSSLRKNIYFVQDRVRLENRNGIENKYYQDVNFDGYLDELKKIPASGVNSTLEVNLYNTSNGNFDIFSKEFTEAVSGSEFELLSNYRIIKTSIQNGYGGYVIRTYNIENGLPKLLNEEEIKSN